MASAYTIAYWWDGPPQATTPITHKGVLKPTSMK